VTEVKIVCPRCRGPLEERIVRTRPIGVEVVYCCLGSCGTQWSLFDLTKLREA
jgi:hypothetical protein